jgi:hypothetical protein
MMFCRRCGKEISEDMRYCPYCGASTSLGIEDGRSRKRSGFWLFSLARGDYSFSVTLVYFALFGFSAAYALFYSIFRLVEKGRIGGHFLIGYFYLMAAYTIAVLAGLLRSAARRPKHRILSVIAAASVALVIAGVFLMLFDDMMSIPT